MSLKAKIEAIIYASEEPITLQQLLGLLGGEAQAELDRRTTDQGELALGDPEPTLLQTAEAGNPDALNAETLAPADEVASAPSADESLRAPQTPAAEAPAAVTSPESSASEQPAPEQTSPEQSAPEPAAAEQSAPEPTAAELRLRERHLREFLRSVLDELIRDYAEGDRGLEIREVAGGLRLATKPEYHDAVRGFVRSLKPPLKLSLQALETLAVVAYKQPVTAPEVSEIRGVDSAGVLGSLMGRKLVATAGRKQVIGRPILYKTTKDFLLRFGLKDLGELPSIEEFERMAGDLAEAVQEEMPMAAERLDEMQPDDAAGDAPRNVEPMRDEHAAQADGFPESGSAEHTTPAPDGPGEFTGDETVPPADDVEVDGRNSALPPNYEQPNVGVDSPALDAEIQGSAENDAGGSE